MFDPTHHVAWPMAGNRHEEPLGVEAYAPDRLWYRTVLLGAVHSVHSHVPARPAARKSFSYKWVAAGWGE